MKNIIFTGAAVAIVTPMHKDGTVNYDKLEELLEEQISKGTDAIVICGTTGESATLSGEEHVDCIKFAINKVIHRIPVIAGTGSNDTAYATEMSIDAE
ncbi:MAG: dihydrodipicolinate synthase family protein, partial [Ruminiclostridium sp.]|nr:dihydrodipicolinate synthase family protein [Ruminiclostridium sp.]